MQPLHLRAPQPPRAARWAACLALAVTTITAAAPARAAEPDGPKRVEFDDRLIRGQRRGTGTVYIFQREKVELRSMVARPRSFRQRIVAQVFRD